MDRPVVSAQFAFVGRVAGLRDVVTFEGTTLAEVEQAFRDSVDDYPAFCAERGEPPDQPYSGKIPLLVAPELHRRAAVQVQACGCQSQPMDRRSSGAGIDHIARASLNSNGVTRGRR